MFGMTSTLFLFLSISLASCGTMSRMELDSDNADALRYAQTGDLETEVESLAKPLVDNKLTPGIVVGVMTSDGKFHFYGYGVTDKQTNTVPNADTLFAIGSVSKGFLGATTALLVSDGVFSWNDTLETLLPAGTELSADAKKITLLQLATHTSGLPRQPMTLELAVSFFKFLFTGENFYHHVDSEYVLNYLAAFKAPHDKSPLYSNIGYGLLGYIVELRTGQSLDTLLAQKLTLPYGMNRTGYEEKKLAGYAYRARAYAGDQPKFIRRNESVPDWEFTDLMRGSAGLHSTARDLLRFAALHLRNDDTKFSRVLADTMNVRFARPIEGTAIGWLVDDIGKERITYQFGLVAGYTSYLGVDRSRNTAVVVLQNSFNWTERVGHRLLLRLARSNEN